MVANSQLIRICEDIHACSSLDDASKILVCIRENKLEEIAQSDSQSYTLHTGFEERIWDLIRKHYDMRDDGPCRKANTYLQVFMSYERLAEAIFDADMGLFMEKDKAGMGVYYWLAKLSKVYSDVYALNQAVFRATGLAKSSQTRIKVTATLLTKTYNMSFASVAQPPMDNFVAKHNQNSTEVQPRRVSAPLVTILPSPDVTGASIDMDDTIPDFVLQLSNITKSLNEKFNALTHTNQVLQNKLLKANEHIKTLEERLGKAEKYTETLERGLDAYEGPNNVLDERDKLLEQNKRLESKLQKVTQVLSLINSDDAEQVQTPASAPKSPPLPDLPAQLSATANDSVRISRSPILTIGRDLNDSPRPSCADEHAHPTIAGAGALIEAGCSVDYLNSSICLADRPSASRSPEKTPTESSVTYSDSSEEEFAADNTILSNQASQYKLRETQYEQKAKVIPIVKEEIEAVEGIYDATPPPRRRKRSRPDYDDDEENVFDDSAEDVYDATRRRRRRRRRSRSYDEPIVADKSVAKRHRKGEALLRRSRSRLSRDAVSPLFSE